MEADDPKVTLSLSDLKTILFLCSIPPMKYGAYEDRYKRTFARVTQIVEHAEPAYQVSGVTTTSDEPHHPMRDDAVARWIKCWRNSLDQQEWYVLDHLLDDYRAHADYGLDLHEEVPEPPERLY